MKITTEHIIKILPFEPEYRDKLLAMLSTPDPDMRSEIEQVLWDTYFDLYKVKLEGNMRDELENIQKNKLPLSDQFYSKVVQKTELEMENEMVEEAISEHLTKAREQIDQIIKNGKSAA